MANFVCFLAARAAKAGRDVRNGRPPRRWRRGCASTRRRKRTRGFRRPPTCSGSAPTRSAGSPSTSSSGWTSAALDRQIAADRARGELPFLVVGTAGSVSTGAVDPLAGDRGDLPAPSTSGFTSTARTARSRRGCRARRTSLRGAERRRLGGRRSAQVAVRAARSRLRAGAASRRICCDAFSYHPAYYHFDHDVTELLRLRSAELARFSRAEGVAGAAAGRTRGLRADDRATTCASPRHLHALVQQHPDFEAMTQHLSITTFRYVPRDLRSTASDTGDRGVSAAAESGAADARRTQRRGVPVERDGRRPLRAARVHRELPHVDGRHRSAAAAARAPRRGGSPGVVTVVR